MSSLVASGLLATSLIGVQPSITSYCQSNLKDLKFTWTVVSSNQRELQKVNRDFAQSMRFKYSNVELREPWMLRMESVVEDANVLFIVNGSTKVIKVPRAGISNREDVSKAPGKRQTAFDFGLLTPALFNNYYQAKYVRQESRGDYSGYQVFDVTYVSRLPDKTRNRIWVDTNHKLIGKREWYGQDGALKATFMYSNPTQSSGVWVPTGVKVYNATGALCGTSSFTNIKANTGIDQNRFLVN